MPVIALTGGVAAGKSTVAAVFREEGAVVLDADVFARQAVAPGPPQLAQIAARFGASVLHADGSLNREELGSRVFSDDDARADLNAIVHPRVKELFLEALGRAQKEHPGVPVVYDIPLLSESRARDEFDLVILVDSPASVREARLIAHRGLNAEEAKNRVMSQASDDERRAIADVVIDSSRSLEGTREAARQVINDVFQCWPHHLSDVRGTYPESTT